MINQIVTYYGLISVYVETDNRAADFFGNNDPS